MKKFLVLLLSASIVNAATNGVSYDKVFQGANAPRNYIRNPGAEKNDRNVTDSSSIHSRTTTTPLFNIGSHLIDGSASSQDVDFLADNFETGLLGANCEARFTLRGDASLYSSVVRINGADVSTPLTLPNTGTLTQPVSIYFPCGESGVSPVLRITSTSASAAEIRVDNVYLGAAVSLGDAAIITPWVAYTPTGSWVSNTTYTGRWRRVGDSLEIEVLAQTSGAPTAAALTVNIPSGLTIDTSKLLDSTATVQQVGTAEIRDVGVELYAGKVNYNSTTSVSVYGYRSSSGSNPVPITYGAAVNNTFPITFGSGDQVFVYARVPIVGWTSSTAIRPELSSWKVDANISGANPSLGTGAVSDYTGITNGSLTLTNNSGTGNIAAQIGCSTTNSPTGTTCSSGDESISIAFTPTGNFPQDVEVCAYFSYATITSTTSGTNSATVFQLVETAPNSQTPIQFGKTRLESRGYTNSANSNLVVDPITNCGTFTFTSGGQKMIRLMYERNTFAGSITDSFIIADALSSTGDRDIRFTARPITQGYPAPILVGSVTSNSVGAERIERASVTTVCTSSPCTISSQSGNWLSSISRTGTGIYTLNINSGIFSIRPTCTVISVNVGSASTYASGPDGTPSTTSWIFTTSNQAGTLEDSRFDIICMGPR